MAGSDTRGFYTQAAAHRTGGSKRTRPTRRFYLGAGSTAQAAASVDSTASGTPSR